MILFILVALYFSSAEITNGRSLRDRLNVPNYSQQEARSVGWAPQDQRLKNVYIKLYNSNTVNKDALRNAFQFYERNSCTSSVVRNRSCCIDMNEQTMAISDFTRPSNEKRLHLINLQTGVSRDLLVSHGSGSDRNHDRMVDSFSNSAGSNSTPAGFLIARGTYMGNNGLSLNLHGVETRNNNSFSRRIVVHGANYVASGGRSQGCLAVEPSETRSVVDVLKEDALVYNFNGETSVQEDLQRSRTCVGVGRPQ